MYEAASSMRRYTALRLRTLVFSAPKYFTWHLTPQSNVLSLIVLAIQLEVTCTLQHNDVAVADTIQ